MKTESKKILYKTTGDLERDFKNIFPRMAKTASKFMLEVNNIIDYSLNSNLNEIDLPCLKHHYSCFLDENDFRGMMKVGFDDYYDAADFGLYLPADAVDAVSTFNSSYVTDLKISLYVRARFINNKKHYAFNDYIATRGKNGYYMCPLREMNFWNNAKNIQYTIPDMLKQMTHWYDEERNEVTFFLYFCKINDMTLSYGKLPFYCCEMTQQYIDAGHNYFYIENYLRTRLADLRVNSTDYCTNGYDSPNFGLSDKLWMKMMIRK